MGDLNWPVRSGGVKKDTNTGSTGSKEDSGKNLAGNQHVNVSLVNYLKHLPYSPAGGAPVHQGEFTQGHKWTEVDGKIHDGAGPSNMSW